MIVKSLRDCVVQAAELFKLGVFGTQSNFWMLIPEYYRPLSSKEKGKQVKNSLQYMKHPFSKVEYRI